MPPAADLYWTPGYWAWNDAGDDYAFNAGYWGPEVGFYGGIDYGYGYTGEGYHGGYWRDHRFFYNRVVNNLEGARIAHAFNQPVQAQPGGVAFNGGRGGTTIRPNPQQIALAHGRHTPLTAVQMQHIQEARRTPELRFNQNHGIPPIAATQRPGAFHGAHVAAATAAGALASHAHALNPTIGASQTTRSPATQTARSAAHGTTTHAPGMKRAPFRRPCPGAARATLCSSYAGDAWTAFRRSSPFRRCGHPSRRSAALCGGSSFRRRGGAASRRRGGAASRRSAAFCRGASFRRPGGRHALWRSAAFRRRRHAYWRPCRRHAFRRRPACERPGRSARPLMLKWRRRNASRTTAACHPQTGRDGRDLSSRFAGSRQAVRLVREPAFAAALFVPCSSPDPLLIRAEYSPVISSDALHDRQIASN